MTNVKFSKIDEIDGNKYIFISNANNEYILFSDERGLSVNGLTPDFWDKFYFCESIKIESKREEDSNIISRIISYK